MADTMPPPVDNTLPTPLGDASWNPALRPEDSSDFPEKQSQSHNEGELFSNEQNESDGTEQDFSSLLQQNDAKPSEPEQVATVAQPSIAVETPESLDQVKPQEFSWGEDAEVSWDVSSPQDPFNREDIVGRTNSFPPVENNTELSGSDSALNQVENETEAEMQHQDMTFPETLADSDQANIDSWDANAADDESGFFDQLKTQTKPIYDVPPEAESRFEEGVPLVPESNLDSQPEPAAEPTTNTDQHLENLFEADGEGEDGDDFFKSTGFETANNEKPTITRKSTHEVISTLSSGEIDSPIDEPSAEAKFGDAVIHEEEEDLAARWEAELDDDDDLLLEDDLPKQASEAQEAYTPVQPSAAPAVAQRPQTAPYQARVPANPYAPHQPSSSELLQGIPNPYAPTSSLPATPFAAPLATPFAPTQAETQQQAKAHSFAAQSREGYQSPYDLPDTLSRPRRPAARKVAPPTPNGVPNTMPPPRSSSIPAPAPPPPAMASSLPNLNSRPPPSNEASAAKNFFEELPAPPQRTRPGSRSGRYTPQPAPTLNAPAQSMAPPPVPPVPSAEPVSDNIYQSQLQAPERMDPYSNLSVPSAPVGPGTGPRYSPKPPGGATAGKPSVSPRYSPAPPSSQASLAGRPRYASQPANLPFQPRTSSPLAHHERFAYEAQQSHERPSTSPGPTSQPNPALQPGSQQLPSVPSQLAHSAPYSPPKNPFAEVATVSEPSQRPSTESPYLPGTGAYQPVISSPPNDIQFAPPRRSQTQSPGKQSSGPILTQTAVEAYPRPASVHAPSSPTKTINPYTVTQAVPSSRQNPDLPFVEPTDGQELDPLQRWRGAPIFKFGFGGVVSSCFPQHIPRYSAGQMTPMIKPAPGEPRIRQFKDIVPSDGDIVSYPGPLKTKSKKKDVVAWLSSRIAALENEGVPLSLQAEPDGFKRHEEKVVLWKLIRVLVENDGSLDKSADIQKSIQNIVSPGLELSSSNAPFDAGAGSGIYQPNSTSVQAEAVGSDLLQSIKKDLLVGDREKAVWQAVDGRLWGHAMIMSSALDKNLWKQVVQEFVKREVRSAGENTESLAALYAVLSGNFEESVDELVPQSARLGLQMFSKGGQGSTKNALDGLDRWRETLGLVLNNRTTDDHRALLSMGQLLASYHRTEASHICYLFARAFSQSGVFGGFDDAQTNVVLLGTDHRIYPTTFFRDEDAIALTEVYEFATCTLAGNQTAALPYLQPFKLHHAYALAEQGSRNDAQQYCDAIGTLIKSSTKPSPYFHQGLFAEIDELANRLRQAPSDGTSSWMSKPSMEKVSGSMWAKFSSFVAGDESDAASNASAMDADVGPFAKISGTPTVSRSPSVSDLYGSYPVPQGASNASSRYAPGNQYAPGSSPEHHRGRSSLDSQRSPPLGGNVPQRRGSQEPATPVDSSSHIPAQPNFYGSPSSYPYHSTPPQSSYMPLAPVDENPPSQPQQPFPIAAQQSALTTGLQAASATFGQPIDELRNAAAEVPHYGGYEPPAASSYEPPSYQPDLSTADIPEDEAEEENKPKKKSYFDDEDDDDLAARAASVKNAEKARRDKEADDAFRKAAEADAEKPAAAKKGWFGGWWGGKKEGESSGGGPIRAKLGEENSFYYDPELKKWVNKKDPSSATATARATPPPPKGPMPQSRSASAGSTSSIPPMLQRPPSMSELGTSMDSRPSTGTGAPLAGSPVFPSSLGVPVPGGPNGFPRAASTGPAPTPPGSSSGLAPPPRPSTSLSTASSIDDLLGAPQARKGGTLKSKKKGRGYVDVMAK